jgi:hypothetical protein
MNMRFNMQQKKGNKGVTLLVALLVMNILLAVGFSISNLSYKSLRLSSSGEDTQYAYYAAEAGFECAQYHDKDGAFSGGVDTTIECNGESLDVAHSGDEYTFELPFLGGAYCARLIVRKPDEVGSPRTIIEARGYNTCNLSAPSVVERGIRVIKY